MSFLSRLNLGKSTLSGILNDKYKYQSHTFPSEINNIGGGHNHAMVFHIWERSGTKFADTAKTGRTTNPSDIRQTVKQVPNLIKQTGGIIQNAVGSRLDSLTQNIPKDIKDKLNEGQQQLTKAGDVLQDTIDKIPVTTLSELRKSIVLYIPQKLETDYAADWGQGSFRETEALRQSMGSASDFFTNLGLFAIEGIIKRIDQQKGTNIADLLSLGLGIAANPHLEALFNGVNFREFEFEFKLIPRNEKEAIAIHNIEKTFRFYMMPEISGGLGGRYFQYPAEFTIDFISYGKTNEFINKIGRCVLTNMSVDRTGADEAAFLRRTQGREQVFNEDGVKTVKGNPAVSTTLRLRFRETEIVTRERVLEDNY